MVVFNAFHVYILTNRWRNVLYIGMSNNLPERLYEHYLESTRKNTFAGKYNCYHLIYYEVYFNRPAAFYREREIKKWRREKKEKLINKDNPNWQVLNSDFLEWPPDLNRIGRNY